MRFLITYFFLFIAALAQSQSMFMQRVKLENNDSATINIADVYTCYEQPNGTAKLIIGYPNSTILTKSDFDDVIAASCGNLIEVITNQNGVNKRMGINPGWIYRIYRASNKTKIQIKNTNQLFDTPGSYEATSELFDNCGAGSVGLDTVTVSGDTICFTFTGDLSPTCFTVGGFSCFNEVTYAEMTALMAANSLIPGCWYNITDAAGTDMGFITHALTTNEISVQGSGGFLNADFQSVGVYSGVIGETGIAAGTQKGIWRTAFEVATITYINLAGGTYAEGDVITGGTTGATAVVLTDDGVGSMTVYMTSAGVAFNGSEVLDNGAGVTADMDGAAGSPDISEGDIVIWNLTHYQLTDDSQLNGTDPATNTAAYTELARTVTDVGYVAEWDVVEFDFVTNQLVYDGDLRGNLIRGNTAILGFQRGSDSFTGNNIQNPATFDLKNLIASFNKNTTYSGANVSSIVTGTGTAIENNILENGAQLTDITAGANCSISRNTIGQGATMGGSTVLGDGATMDDNVIGAAITVSDLNLADGGFNGCILSGSLSGISNITTVGGGEGLFLLNLFNSTISNIDFSGGAKFEGLTLIYAGILNKSITNSWEACYIQGTNLDEAESVITEQFFSNRVTGGFSNFYCTIDVTGLTTLDITAAKAQYCGIINVTSSNATETIDEITNFPTLFPFTLRPVDGLSVTIAGTPIGSAAAGDIVFGPTAVSVTVNGDNEEEVQFIADPDGGGYVIGFRYPTDSSSAANWYTTNGSTTDSLRFARVIKTAIWLGMDSTGFIRHQVGLLDGSRTTEFQDSAVVMKFGADALNYVSVKRDTINIVTSGLPGLIRLRTDTIKFYDYYRWANAAPSSTNGVMSFHYWEGNGTDANPGFITMSQLADSLSAGVSISADNGLTENVSNNIRLGGTLLANTSIATGSNKLSVTTATAGVSPFEVVSTTGTGVTVTATTGTAINATATGSNATGIFNKHASSTTGVAVPLHVTRSSTGTATSGIASAFDFYLQNGSGALPNATRLVSTLTDVTNTAEVSSFGINLMNSGTLTQRVLAEGGGRVTFSAYGDGTFAGTPTYISGWDADGKFVETTVSGILSTADNIYNHDDQLKNGGTTVSLDSGSLKFNLKTTAAATVYGIEMTASDATGSNRFLSMKTAVDSARFQESSGDYLLIVSSDLQLNVSDQTRLVHDSLQIADTGIEAKTTIRSIWGSTPDGWLKRFGGNLATNGTILKSNGTDWTYANWFTTFNGGTQNTTAWTINDANTNVNAAIVPKGTGALIADIPDGTSAGGNARGTNAVDWQTNRNNAAQVASGTSSVVAGGALNTASAQYSSVLGGYTCTASGAGSVAMGGNSGLGAGVTASGTSSFAFGTGASATGTGAVAFNGDATATGAVSFGGAADKYYMFTTLPVSFLRWSNDNTIGTAATEIFLDGASLTATIPSGERWQFEIAVFANTGSVGDGTGTANHQYCASYTGVIRNVGGTTSFLGSVDALMAAKSDASMADASFTITADDAGDYLKVVFNPPSTAGSISQYVVGASMKMFVF